MVQIYDGAATQFTDTITTAMNSVAYRVRAKDSKNAYSGYTTSPTRTVTHNVDPTVSGTDQNLGTITSPPSYQYTVNDGDEADTLVIVESLDGVAVRTIDPATRNQSYTFALTEAQFAGLTGQHTMTIKVTDSAGNSVTRTITFSRSVSIIDFDWKVDDTSAAAENPRVHALQRPRGRRDCAGLQQLQRRSAHLGNRPARPQAHFQQYHKDR